MTKNQKIIASVVGLLLLSRLVRAGTSGVFSNSNVNAFLKMIQYAEGTYNRPNPYAVTFAYSHTIQDFSDHPAITGEWTGYPLADQYCIAAGINPPCVSTAAGAYQFLRPTWIGIKNRLGNIRFDAAGQDLGAINLIERKGALSDIENGNLMGAINKVNTVWASLPGSPYGQPTKSYSQLESFYLSHGGNIFSS